MFGNGSHDLSPSHALHAILWANLAYQSQRPEHMVGLPLIGFFFFNFLSYIGVWSISNIVIVSCVQQSDSVIHLYGSILFQIRCPFSLLHNIKQSFLCYIVGLF